MKRTLHVIYASVATLALGFTLTAADKEPASPEATSGKKPNILGRWRVDHAFVMVPAQQFVAQLLATFKEFPPSQRPGSFSIDQALQSLQDAPKATGD